MRFRGIPQNWKEMRIVFDKNREEWLSSIKPKYQENRSFTMAEIIEDIKEQKDMTSYLQQIGGTNEDFISWMKIRYDVTWQES